MAQITSSVGLISGINTSAIIDALMQLNQAPVTLLQTQVNSFTTQKNAYNSLESKLTSLQSIGKSLELPATFRASTATSSDPSVLTATTTAGAPSGSYQFQVAQLVSAQQSVSNGYASTSSTLQAGTITLDLGGGSLAKSTRLGDLNGGAGISGGQFRITDRSGKTDVIDTSGALTLDDVVKKINTSLGISVQASIRNNRLVLADASGGTGTLTVQDMAGGTAAQSLGIAGSATGSTLTGSSINFLGSNTALATLNDGRGITTSGKTSDLTITTADGSNVSVSLTGAQTIGDVLSAINKAGNGKVKASIAAGAAGGITLSDLTTGGGSMSVADANGSHAAEDLGIASPGAAGTINGRQILSGIDTTLIGSLNGGRGLTLGQLSVTKRSGAQTAIDLSGAKTVQDVLDAINGAGAGLTASLNAAGNGIQLTDTTGGTGNLVIGDADSSKTAEALGLAGTFDTGTASVNGGNLHAQYISANTTLSSYNGGKGVGTGRFTITNASGASATIDTSSGTFNTIGDVLTAINATSLGVTASINATGNGILLTDNSGGAGHMIVQSLAGTTAADLHLTGAAAANTIDGALETKIQVNAGDTLSAVQARIQAANFGLAANIINDGSAGSPYRLSLTATHSGTAGQVVIDTGTTGLQMRTLVQAQDAAVFVGGTGSGQPLLVTSNTNQLTNVIPGVTVSLLSASTQPTTLSITPDGSGVEKQLQTFTDTFNGLVDAINTYTQFDTTTNTAGLLLGDPTTQMIQEKMYQVFSAVVSTAGQFRTLGDVGLTLGDGAKITFDPNAFNNAFAENPDAVKTLFSQTSIGLGAVIDKSITSLVDPTSGSITEQDQTLTNETTDFQKQITQLNSVLADKRAMLQQQFANMETTLATLQSQQAALGTITGIKAATSSSSGSSGSTSSSNSSSSGSSSTSSTKTG